MHIPTFGLTVYNDHLPYGYAFDFSLGNNSLRTFSLEGSGVHMDLNHDGLDASKKELKL